MKNSTIIAIAVAVAVIILGLQGYIVFQLHKRLNQVTWQNDQTGTPPIKTPGGQKPVLPKSDLDDKFFDSEFFNARPWSPYEEMRHMQEEMEQLFGKSLSHFHINSPLGSLSKMPEADLQDKPDYYLVTVNAPGADEASVDVKLKGQHLYISIKTEQKNEGDEKNGNYRYRERFVGEFQRALTLPGPGEADKMTTEYHKGVLMIKIPKSAQPH